MTHAVMWIRFMPTRKNNVIQNSKVIALAPALQALARAADQSPPNVYIDKALELIGPDIRRCVKNGWTDEDLIEAFEGQDPDAVKELLKTLRDQEREARHAREQAKAQRRHTGSRQAGSQSPSVPLLPGGSAPLRSGTLSPLGPPLMPPSPAAEGNRHVTRNRGIARRNPKDQNDG